MSHPGPSRPTTGVGPSGYPTLTHPLLVTLTRSSSSSSSSDATLVDTYVPPLRYREPSPPYVAPPPRPPREGWWGRVVDAAETAGGACLDGLGYLLWCMVS